MGSYSTLYVAGQDLGSTKNGIDPSVMLLFRASDRREVILEPGTREYLVYFGMPEPGDKWVPSEQRQVLYQTTCGVVKDRLNLLGFTYEASCRAFQLAVDRELTRLASDDDPIWRERIALLQVLTPESWREGVKEIRRTGRATVDRRSAAYTSLSPILRHILDGWTDEWMGCPVHDVRHVIRLFVELVDSEEEVLYDLTALVAGGWLDDETDLIEYMDFEGARVAGGSGAMANTVKAFVGAGILNRVVAVFDNDTAAAEALAALGNVTLPENFAVIQYPELPLLDSYQHSVQRA